MQMYGATPGQADRMWRAAGRAAQPLQLLAASTQSALLVQASARPPRRPPDLLMCALVAVPSAPWRLPQAPSIIAVRLRHIRRDLSPTSNSTAIPPGKVYTSTEYFDPRTSRVLAMCRVKSWR